MATKYKMTGCAKFFFFFIIAAPLAYFGASYYNGQDPVQQVRDFFKTGTTDQKETVEITQNENAVPTQGEDSNSMELKDLQIKTIETKLENCREENEKQEILIESLNKEIARLKQKAGE